MATNTTNKRQKLPTQRIGKAAVGRTLLILIENLITCYMSAECMRTTMRAVYIYLHRPDILIDDCLNTQVFSILKNEIDMSYERSQKARERAALRKAAREAAALASLQNSAAAPLTPICDEGCGGPTIEQTLSESAECAPTSANPVSTEQTPTSANPVSTEQTPTSANPVSVEQTPTSANPDSTEQTPTSANPDSAEQAPISANPDSTEQTPTSANPDSVEQTPTSANPDSAEQAPISANPVSTEHAPTSVAPVNDGIIPASSAPANDEDRTPDEAKSSSDKPVKKRRPARDPDEPAFTYRPPAQKPPKAYVITEEDEVEPYDPYGVRKAFEMQKVHRLVRSNLW